MFQRYERDMRDPLRTKKAQLKSPGSDNYSGYLMSAKVFRQWGSKPSKTWQRVYFFLVHNLFSRGVLLQGIPDFQFSRE